MATAKTKRARKQGKEVQASSVLAMPALADEHLDIGALETWLWDAACAIRGATDAPKFKDFILPLIFFKRLSDVFDDEFAGQVTEFGDEEIARDVVQADHADALKTGRKPIVRFFIPREYSWATIRNHPADGMLGQFVTDAMREVARLNPDLQGVLDIKDYNERQSGQRTLDDDRLAALIEVISRHRLGLKNTEPDILGRAYEYLLRKFAEGQGQSAGEFYTPKEVGWLMAHILDPKPYTTIYDPACGSAGLLIKCRLLFEQKHPELKGKAPKLHGQELNAVTFAMAKMNMFLHDYPDSFFAIGDTFKNPGFAVEGTGLKRFDYVVANPMWNQDNYDETLYENDPWKRFVYGSPPASTADWGWLQQIVASLNERGKAAVVLDTNAVSRGSGAKTSRERDIRKRAVEAGLIEAVVLLPENLFYNTGAPGIILVLDKGGLPGRPIKLVNASRLFTKGSPKNFIDDGHVQTILRAMTSEEEIEALSCILTIDEVRDIDYDLSPARHVPIDPDIPILSLQESSELRETSFGSWLSVSSEGRDAFADVLRETRLVQEGMPESWLSKTFGEVVTQKIAGDWGESDPCALREFVHCRVVRGTDFDDVAKGKLEALPHRLIANKAYQAKRPRPSDILVEVSGGGKYQNTGRVVFLDADLLNSSDPPLYYTNFTKLLRIKENVVNPKYFYYAWQRLYDLGRTARYEKQPTNIKNFKLDDFLRHETIAFPRDLSVQTKIVNLLDSVHSEINAYGRHLLALMSFRLAAMAELLTGKRPI